MVQKDRQVSRYGLALRDLIAESLLVAILIWRLLLGRLQMMLEVSVAG